MTALMVVPAVKVRHGRTYIGHGLPVLTEGELIFIGPVEALQDSRAARLGDLAAHPTAILQTALLKEVTGKITTSITLHQDGFLMSLRSQDSYSLVQR